MRERTSTTGATSPASSASPSSAPTPATAPPPPPVVVSSAALDLFDVHELLFFLLLLEVGGQADEELASLGRFVRIHLEPVGKRLEEGADAVVPLLELGEHVAAVDLPEQGRWER